MMNSLSKKAKCFYHKIGTQLQPDGQSEREQTVDFFLLNHNILSFLSIFILLCNFEKDNEQVDQAHIENDTLKVQKVCIS